MQSATNGQHRQSLFEQRCQAVLAQNLREGSAWKASLNHFADRTDAELQSLLGYKRTSFSQRHRRTHSTASFLSVVTSKTLRAKRSLPEAVDWRRGLQSSDYIRHQGQCGSCWAIATAGAVEMHAELRNGNAVAISADHLVQCVPNPQRCGGTGGCHGATAEIAFQFMKQQGVMVEQGFGLPVESAPCGLHRGRRALVSGFVQLPANRAEPLLEALATHGPVVLSVDASGWFLYESGIYDECDRDAIVNHAVLAVGYERDAYIIRNSWGRSWGEDGHIRLLRHAGGGDGYCGIDRSPEEGVACANGPSEVPVCGMCGVLADASYPVGVHFVGEAAGTSVGLVSPRKIGRAHV